MPRVKPIKFGAAISLIRHRDSKTELAVEIAATFDGIRNIQPEIKTTPSLPTAPF